MNFKYINCKNVSKDDIYQGFIDGYKDYILPIKITKDLFFEKFFIHEGNEYENSFIAYKKDKPIGLILGGIRTFHGMKTIRCGGFCVLKEFRGTEIAYELFKRHLEIAKEKNVKQLFLEVLLENKNARNFYKRNQYHPVYDLKYYKSSNLNTLEKKFTKREDIIMRKSTWMEINIFFGNYHTDIHIPWQNTLKTLEHQENLLYYIATDKNNKSIAYIISTKEGSIKQIWVEPMRRLEGIATYMILYLTSILKLNQFSISFSNSSSLEGFVRSLDSTEKSYAQKEMFRYLDD